MKPEHCTVTSVRSFDRFGWRYVVNWELYMESRYRLSPTMASTVYVGIGVPLDRVPAFEMVIVSPGA